MDWKNILLIFAVFIIIAVFYMRITSGCGAREGYESQESEYCKNDYSDAKHLPLREYYIKACFNTAYDGNDVSCPTIVKRIHEGYRYLDFNLFYASGDIYVGYSHGNKPELVDSGNLKFTEALECIATNAFTKPKKPEDAVAWDYTSNPLIVNIRVFRSADSTIDVIAEVAKIINPGASSTAPVYSSNYYVDNKNIPISVDSCTKLSDISRKIIFTMNIQNILEVYTPRSQNAELVPVPTTVALKTFVNFLSGGSTSPAFYRYADASLPSRSNPLMKNTDVTNTYQTNIRYMIVVFPHPVDADVQPDIQLLALNCSALILPMRVYLGDDYGKLTLNDAIFNGYSSSFVPAVMLEMYINKYTGVDKI